MTPTVAPGEVLAATLTWQAIAPLPPTAQVFVQLLDATGNPVAQRDGPLAQGTVDITTLGDGQTITDPHALRFPSDREPGTYQLHIGLYRYDTLKRATTGDGQNDIVIPVEGLEQ